MIKTNIPLAGKSSPLVKNKMKKVTDNKKLTNLIK